MAKSSRIMMINRRRDMLRFDRLGLSAKEFCAKVACKYGVNEAAVLRDWGKREEWMKTFCAEQNNRSLAYELALEYESDCEKIAELIEKEKDTTKLIQLYHLKEKMRDRRKDFLFKIGAFDSLRFDFERQVQDKSRKLFEAEYPWVVGNTRLCNSVMALLKASGRLSMTELVGLEAMFRSLFLGKDSPKPSVTVDLEKTAP
jgi:hypothetical protein